MKALAAILAATLLSGAALAQGRPSTVSRPCAASQQLVAQRGQIVLGTGGATYDRFVADRRFCEFDEFLKPAWVPAADTPACFVGYRCSVDTNWD